MRRCRTLFLALTLALAACGNGSQTSVEASAEEDITSSTAVDAFTTTTAPPTTQAPALETPTSTIATPPQQVGSARGVVLAVRADGTALVAADTIADESSPCGVYTVLVSPNDEWSSPLGQIDGTIDSARSADGQTVRITVQCNGELLTSTATWTDGSIEVSGLENTDGWPTFPLAGSSGVSITLEALERTEACEIDTRLGRILARTANGSLSPWEFPSGDTPASDWIDEFVSTPDGRFALIESFTCSHEGPIKSVASGTFDTSTGELLSLEGVLLPSDFSTERNGWRINHPDALSIGQDGQILAWLGLEGGGLLSVEVG